MIDLAHLEDLINLLRAKGVITFECEDVKLQLTIDPVSAPPVTTSITNPKPPPSSMWEHPNLWPNGKPPTFPK